ncbi:MAG: GNAT family N-acetyltransferase [Prevotella sp.]|nr:GNAT family N-acetyltransferase [Prevotella sp.]
MKEIRLRALEPEDLDILYRIENDRELWQVGVTNVPYSRYVLHDYIAHSSNDIYADRQLRLMIEEAEGDVVGIIDLVNFDPRHLRAEVGVVIRPVYRRQGFATAAVSKLCRYAVDVIHLRQLYVVTAQDNEAAIRLFRKAGFSHSVVLREWLSDGQNRHDAVLLQKFF